MDFFIGIMIGGFIIGGLLTTTSPTIEDGMVACKLEPQRCEQEFKIYQAEQAVDKLKSAREDKTL